MDNTILQQGSFTSDGAEKTLNIRSDVDWMEVINFTQMATQQTPGRGVRFDWQRGLAVGAAIEQTKADGADTLQGETITTGGFILEDGIFNSGVPITGTTITKASPPVCTAANHGLQNNDVVLFTNLTNMPQLNGAFFTVGSVTTNTFELPYFDTNTANFTAETAFTVRKLDSQEWDVQGSVISAVTKGATTQIQFTQAIGNGFTAVDQVIKFIVTSPFGMTQLNGLQGTILSINTSTNTYTVDIDSSSFTDFAWPSSSSLPFTIPQGIGVGTVSGTSLADATNNVALLGMRLGAGVDGPAGSSNDVIFWKAGKSFSVTNE